MTLGTTRNRCASDNNVNNAFLNLKKSKSEERKLNPEEIEDLGQDMNQYAEGLNARIKEINTQLLKEGINPEGKSKLETELKELQEQYKGLKDFVDAIENEDCEEITEK